jgi:hypothetical protein
MSSVIIAGNTSGTITLDAPNVAGTTVLTLPTANGTVLTTGTPQSGSVLQVVQTVFSTNVEIKSTSFTDTGLTSSITPKFSTSKILVIVSQPTSFFENGNAERTSYIQLLRGATVITDKQYLSAAGVGGGAYLHLTLDGSIVYLDSPATTSSTTYKTQATVSSTANDTGLSFNRGNGKSTITLMEIAA